jgi:hypothetical protein
MVGRRGAAAWGASVLLGAALSGVAATPATAGPAVGGTPDAVPADTEAPSLDFAGPAGDFDGNGKDDIVSFTRGIGGDVYVARSNGRRFVGIDDLWSDSFAPWRQAPLVGDVNGDGKSDVVAFTRGDTGAVTVALSTGRAFGRTTTWTTSFATGDSIPAVGDFDGDGKADVAAFDRGRAANVTVALSTGRAFGRARTWPGSFAAGKAIPEVADVNGDGKDDVVAFTRGNGGDVWVALSTGRSFTRPQPWHGWFATGGTLPALGDVNGDGKADLIAFGRGRSAEVTVALSTGRSFRLTDKPWLDSFATDDAVPGVGDFNGDHKADIAAFTRGGTADVYVALSTGRSFRMTPARWQEYFAAATEIPQPGILW